MIDRILLFPYYLTLKLRNKLYDKGIFKTRTVSLPTISIGNVCAGGTGKTPHTEMVLRMLLDSDEWGGRNIAMLSRGYKRQSKGFQQVPYDGTAGMFGDEAVQIKKKMPIVTVAVDKNRIEGCEILANPDKIRKTRSLRNSCWNQDFPHADIVVLDDAFQYRALKPSLSIVLVDYNHPMTKDHLLPFGRLRDLPERVFDADVVVMTKCPDINEDEKKAFVLSLGYSDFNTLTCEAVSPKGNKQQIFFTKIQYAPSRGLFNNFDSRYIYSNKLVLFTGIARSSQLRSYLSDTYKVVRSISFSDHHTYSWSDFQKIVSAVKKHPTAAVATTEKDSQRVVDCKGVPEILKERMFIVPISMVFLSEGEKEIFRRRVVNV